MGKKTLIPLALFIAAIPAYAQHACIRGLGMENAQIWWTGSNNTKYLMDFTAGSPVITTEGIGQTRSIETTAVYTTAAGQLLLYTDGDVIFDGRTHAEIGRGVGGNPSSTEAALIVPAPGGDPSNDFYVFGNTANTTGPINYTRVDIRAGTIDEVEALDGRRVFGESLGTVPHANGIDFWILSVSHEDPTLHAYLITAEGVGESAVRSRLPGLPGPAEESTANRGSVVYHPPSGRLALTFYSWGSRKSLLYTARFDETTGEANSFQVYELGGYGVAFSPDGTKLYFSDGYGGQFRQLDLGTGEAHRVAAGTWAMPRLAPDGKIYVVDYGRSSIGVVENPDAELDALVWDPEGVKLPEGAIAAYSLPNQVYAPCVVNYSGTAPEEGTLSVVIVDGGESAENPSVESIEIVLDMSGSMWGQIEGKAKYEIAREIVATTVRELSAAVKVGVRVYGHRSGSCRDSELLVEVDSSDRNALEERVEDLKPKEGKTPIAYSLEQVAGDLEDLDGSKAILLVSDGLETCAGDPVQAARTLCEAGVGMRVHTVGFDVANAPEAVAQLEAVAAAGCGQFYAAASAAELRRALNAVGQVTFTVTDPQTGESWSGSVGSEAIPVPGGTYRLTIESQPPIRVDELEIQNGLPTTIRLIHTAEGLRPAEGS